MPRVGVAGKTIDTHWRPKGRSTGKARIQRLRQRLETERDERTLEAIRAQLAALDASWRE
jgi:hypothetical protein